MISVVIALLILLVTLSLGLIMFRRRVNDIQNDDKVIISKMAHDIRTPMSVIKTNCEIALMNPSLDGDMKNKMKDIIGELDKISGILQKATQKK